LFCITTEILKQLRKNDNSKNPLYTTPPLLLKTAKIIIDILKPRKNPQPPTKRLPTKIGKLLEKHSFKIKNTTLPIRQLPQEASPPTITAATNLQYHLILKQKRLKKNGKSNFMKQNAYNIQQKDQAQTYLFDSKLNWKQHILTKRKEIHRQQATNIQTQSSQQKQNIHLIINAP
jgi:hypothetical protein